MPRKKKTNAEKIQQIQRLYERIYQQYPSYNDNLNWIEGNRSGEMHNRLRKAAGNALVDSVLKKLSKEQISALRESRKASMDKVWLGSKKNRPSLGIDKMSDRDFLSNHLGFLTTNVAGRIHLNKVVKEGETNPIKAYAAQTRKILGLSVG